MLVPGNPALVQRVIATLLTHENVRLATPGEFSARAYLNGKLTLAQAEGIAATIAARTDAELAAAEALLSGGTGRVFAHWADELTTLLALVEAGIDFTDQEDVVPIAPDDLVRRLTTLAHALADHLGSVRGGEHRDTLPVVALAGPPNAGKSTLFNALLGRRRAVVSPIAGTTRDVLAERLDLSGDAPGADPIMLLDLAGLDASPEWAAGDSAANAIDADAQARAREALTHADIIIHCDPTGRFDTAIPGSTERPTIRARTKSDLPPPSPPRHHDTSTPPPLLPRRRQPPDAPTRHRRRGLHHAAGACDLRLAPAAAPARPHPHARPLAHGPRPRPTPPARAFVDGAGTHRRRAPCRAGFTERTHGPSDAGRHHRAGVCDVLRREVELLRNLARLLEDRASNMVRDAERDLSLKAVDQRANLSTIPAALPRIRTASAPFGTSPCALANRLAESSSISTPSA